MTQLQDLKLQVYTTYAHCTVLRSLTALTSLVLAVRCSPDFTMAPPPRPRRPDPDHPHLQHHTSWPFIDNANINNMQGSGASLDVPAPAAPLTSPGISASGTTESSQTGGRMTDGIEGIQRGSSGEDTGSSGALQLSLPGIGTGDAGTAGSSTGTPAQSSSHGRTRPASSQVDVHQVIDEENTSAAGQDLAMSRQSPFVAQCSPSLIAAAHLSEILSDLVQLQRVVIACCLPPAAAGGDLQDGLKV